jgi:dienelactone hydrolase
VLRPAAEGPTIVETPAFLDANRRLFGILSAPAAENGAAPRRGILLVNAGSIHHIGPNRNYVTLARRWAEKGHVVLRFDVSGIGDSVPHPGEDENVVYSRHADADVAQALAFLRRQPGVGKCVVIGLCSGAYNGFKAGVNGHQVDAIVSINPLTYFWKEGMSLDFAYPEHKVVDDARRYSTNMFRVASWMKLLRGGVNIRDAAQTVFRHGANVVSGRVRELARTLGVEFPDDLASELHRVARRGIRLHFVFAQDEPGLDLLYMQGGRSVERLVRSGKLHIDLIQAPGHTFTATWAQNALAAHLSAIVDAPAS